MTLGQVLLISPRPPRQDGNGDQRRAYEIFRSLSPNWDVEVVSWLPAGGVARLPRTPRGWIRLLHLALRRPLQVALIQSTAPRSLASQLQGFEIVIFVTDRAVPRARFASNVIVDFVDDLSLIAARRAQLANWAARIFWMWEAARVRRYDHKLAAAAAASVAHTDEQARRIDPTVRTIPLAAMTSPMPDDGDKVAFVGNLFFPPNHDAATWICEKLAPYMAAHGIDPNRLLICGRRPSADLVRSAAAAKVDLRADVPEMAIAFREAAVVISPMAIGSGAQYKVIDAVAARRPTVLTALANEGLGLRDEESTLIRPRHMPAFGDAVLALLDSAELRARLSTNAYTQLHRCTPEAVAAAWSALAASILSA
jgi:Glycosyl transferases group 1